MKLSEYINDKMSQVSDDEAFDQIFEDLRMDVEALFPREQEEDVYRKLIERLQLFIGV